jgi:hypothetical protein
MSLEQFSTPDLSAIARGLDELEQSFSDAHRGGSSTNMDDTGVYPVAQYGFLDSHVTRFFLVTSLAESPGSLGSLVSTTSKCLPSTPDGKLIWRQRQQTRKLAE